MIQMMQGHALIILSGMPRDALFDSVITDPPYASGLLVKALEDIAAFDICREHGIIVAESAAETELPALAPPYSLYRQYRYGKIKLSVYHRSGNEDTL